MEKDKNFEYVFNCLIKDNVEGGYSNNPNDKGGPTNHGISLRFAEGTGDIALFDIDKDNDIDGIDIKNLTVEDSKKALFKYFWKKNNYNLIENKNNSYIIFNIAINVGANRANKFIQLAANNIFKKNVLLEDGIVGNKTLSVLNSSFQEDIFKEFKAIVRNYYRNEAFKDDPNGDVFREGWLNRINKL